MGKKEKIVVNESTQELRRKEVAQLIESIQLPYNDLFDLSGLESLLDIQEDHELWDQYIELSDIDCDINELKQKIPNISEKSFAKQVKKLDKRIDKFWFKLHGEPDYYFTFTYEDAQEPTDQLERRPMTALEQAQKIYAICVESARKGDLITYRAVLDKLSYGPRVPGHAIRYGLELVWIACAHTKQPILTSIIVNQSTGEPNPDGYSVKSWKADADKVMKWNKWLPLDDITWDYIWDNRAKLSDKYATRGYWTR